MEFLLTSDGVAAFLFLAGIVSLGVGFKAEFPICIFFGIVAMLAGVVWFFVL